MMQNIEYDPLILFEEYVERFKEDPHDPELEDIEHILLKLGYSIGIMEGEVKDEAYDPDTPPRHALKISIAKDSEEIGDIVLDDWDYTQLPTASITEMDLCFLRDYDMRW